MNYHFDVERLRNEILSLVRANPELEEDGVLRADMIEAETSIEQVLDKLLRGIREAVTMSNAIADEISRLNERELRYVLRANTSRALIFFLMQEAGIKNLERPLGTLSVAQGKPKIIITDEDQVPDKYCRITRTPNKQGIGMALKNGHDVPGAEWSNAEPHLTIRT